MGDVLNYCPKSISIVPRTLVEDQELLSFTFGRILLLIDITLRGFC